jgi:hypothetical protein
LLAAPISNSRTATSRSLQSPPPLEMDATKPDPAAEAPRRGASSKSTLQFSPSDSIILQCTWADSGRGSLGGSGGMDGWVRWLGRQASLYASFLPRAEALVGRDKGPVGLRT